MPILAIPGAQPPGQVIDEAARWSGLAVSWTDGNGRSWDLCEPSSGVVLAPGGIKGFGSPSLTRYSSTAPGVSGSRFKGYRVEEREVFLPLYVWSGRNTTEFAARDRELWAGLRPDLTGTIRVTTPDGYWRELQVRFEDDGDLALDADPFLTGWQLYGVSLVADERPLWRGPERTWTFQGSGASGFFAPTGGVVTISPSQTIGIDGGTVLNDGDVPAWPTWSIMGPCDTVTVGVAGGTVAYQQPLADQEVIVVVTDPFTQGVFGEDGTDLTANAVWSPLPVRPGENEVSVQMTSLGTGAAVSLSMRPDYFRAW